MNQPPPSSSQRLPSFRDMNDLQKAVLNFNKTSIFNKKTYVPNLNLSRTVTPAKAENVTEVKKEPGVRETRRSRSERKLIVPVETFVPHSDSRSGSLPLKTKSRIIGSSSGIKQESINQAVPKDLLNKLPSKFEGLTSVSPQDLPISIPQSRFEGLQSDKKIEGLLTEIFKPDTGESPLFLLKTPKYMPAVNDESKEHPKIKLTDAANSGHKCTIHDLPKGQIGKLQILKSGKLRLVLGECKFWMHRGVQVNFREELAAVKTDPETRSGEIINLGTIQDRVIVVPDTVTKLTLNF